MSCLCTVDASFSAACRRPTKPTGPRPRAHDLCTFRLVAPSHTATALPLASRPLLLFRRLEVADLNRLAKSTSLHPFRTSNALQAAAEMPPRLHDGLAPANTRYFLTTGILLALLILSFLWSTGPSTSSSILIQRLQASEDLYQRTKRKRDAWLDTMGGPVHSTPLVYRWKGA